MFERLTRRASRALVSAQAEAVERRHEYLGTERLLLGLIGVDDGAGGQILAGLGADSSWAGTQLPGLASDPPIARRCP